MQNNFYFTFLISFSAYWYTSFTWFVIPINSLGHLLIFMKNCSVLSRRRRAFNWFCLLNASYFPTAPNAPKDSQPYQKNVKYAALTHKGVDAPCVYFDASISEGHRQWGYPLRHGQAVGTLIIVYNNIVGREVGAIAGDRLIGNGHSLNRVRNFPCKIVSYDVASPIPLKHSIERTDQPLAVLIFFLYIDSHNAYRRLVQFSFGHIL